MLWIGNLTSTSEFRNVIYLILDNIILQKLNGITAMFFFTICNCIFKANDKGGINQKYMKNCGESGCYERDTS